MSGTSRNASSRAVHARLLKALVAGLVLVELAGQAGLVASLVEGGLAAVFHLPFVAPALLASFAAQVLLRPRPVELGAAVAGGMLLFGPLHAHVQAEAHPVVVAAMAALGAGSLAVLTLRALQLRFLVTAGDDSETESVLDVLLPSLLLAAFVVLSGPMVQLTAALWPTTYDQRVLLVEPDFGLPLSFAVARWTATVPGLSALCVAVYVALPLALGLVHAARRRAGESGDVLVAFVALTAVGYLAYHVVPVAGPLYAFPGAFPGGLPSALPDLATLSSGRTPVQPMPRNCMPSLHTAWALLVWWNARPLGVAVRAAATAFFAVTLLATMGLGFHYAVDLVAAWPLAMAVEAWNAPANTRGRSAAMAGGALGTAAWIAFVAWCPWAVTAPAAVVLAAGAAIVAASEWTQRRLARDATIARQAQAQPVSAPRGLSWTSRVAMAGLALTSAGVAVLLRIVAHAVAPVAGFGAWPRDAGAMLLALSLAAGLAVAAPSSPAGAGDASGKSLFAPSVRDRNAALLAFALVLLVVLSCSALADALSAFEASRFATTPAAALFVAVAATALAGIATGMLVAAVGSRIDDAATKDEGSPFREDAAGLHGLALASASALGGAASGVLLTTGLAIPSLWSQSLAAMLAAGGALLLGAAALASRGHAPSGVDNGAAYAGERAAPALACVATGAATAFALSVHGRFVETLLGATVYARGEQACAVLAGLAAGCLASTLHAGDARSRRKAAATSAAAAALVVAVAGGLWGAAPEWFASFASYVDGHGLMGLARQREALRFFAAVFFLMPLALAAGVAVVLVASVRTRAGQVSGGGLAAALAGTALGIGAAHAAAALSCSWMPPIAVLALVSATLVVLAPSVAAGDGRRDGAAAGTLLFAAAVVVVLAGGPGPADLSSASAHTLAPESHDGGSTDVEAAFSDADGVALVRRGPDAAARLVVDGLDRPRAVTALAAIDLVAGRQCAVVLGLDANGEVEALAAAGFAQVRVVEPRDAVAQAVAQMEATAGNSTAPAVDRAGGDAVGRERRDPRAWLAWDAAEADYIRVAAVEPVEAMSAQFSTREFHALAAARLAGGGVLEQHVATRRLGAMGMASMLASVRRSFADVRVLLDSPRFDDGPGDAAGSARGGDSVVIVACPVECGLAGAALAADATVLSTADIDRLLESIASQVGVPAEALGASDRDLFLPFQATAAWAPATSAGSDARALLAGFAGTRN